MNNVLTSLRFLPACALCLLPAIAAHGGVRENPDIEPSLDYPMSTDRPDTTESPFTVKRGHWQFEWETLSVSFDGGQQSEDWGSVNIKYGLSLHTDIQFVTPAWHAGDGEDGWTDMELRFKWNLTGRETFDGEQSNHPIAVALMPYLKLPTASHDLGNGHLEGGLIIPFAFTKTPLSCMVQADLIRNEADTGYTGAFTFSATYGFELSEQLSAFTEVVATLPLDGAAETYLNGGLVYAISPDWCLDAGLNVGLNGEATDLRLFTGMSRRF
jgi:hypothetical protein